MADGAGTLELVARELAVALAPLEQRLAAGNAELLLTAVSYTHLTLPTIYSV